jgi:hypothetical protein
VAAQGAFLPSSFVRFGASSSAAAGRDSYAMAHAQAAGKGRSPATVMTGDFAFDLFDRRFDPLTWPYLVHTLPAEQQMGHTAVDCFDYTRLPWQRALEETCCNITSQVCM